MLPGRRAATLPRVPVTERINGPRCLFQQHRLSLESFGGVELAGGG